MISFRWSSIATPVAAQEGRQLSLCQDCKGVVSQVIYSIFNLYLYSVKCSTYISFHCSYCIEVPVCPRWLQDGRAPLKRSRSSRSSLPTWVEPPPVNKDTEMNKESSYIHFAFFANLSSAVNRDTEWSGQRNWDKQTWTERIHHIQGSRPWTQSASPPLKWAYDTGQDNISKF